MFIRRIKPPEAPPPPLEFSVVLTQHELDMMVFEMERVPKYYWAASDGPPPHQPRQTEAFIRELKRKAG